MEPIHSAKGKKEADHGGRGSLIENDLAWAIGHR
jgi:hypothetical protein